MGVLQLSNLLWVLWVLLCVLWVLQLSVLLRELQLVQACGSVIGNWVRALRGSLWERNRLSWAALQCKSANSTWSVAGKFLKLRCKRLVAGDKSSVCSTP